MRFRLPIKPDEIPVDEKQQPNDDEANVTPQSASKEAATSRADQVDDDKSDVVNPEFQHGVQSAQAMTQVWSKQHLILAYVISFKEHSLTGTTTILSTLIGGLFKLPYAKLIDIWGRPQGFALMIACMTVGLIMMAGCNNVQTYCAAQVFYSVGSAGVDFTLTIFIADTSALKNRAFWLGFVGSPYIATVWAYGPATEDILSSMGWRWGFGIWAIVTPVMLTPLFFLFYYNQRKAQKAGLVPERHSQRTVMQSIAYYGKEFDVIGLLLLTTGLALFLLAFNLYSKQPDEWKSPLIICFIVIGGLLLIAFPVYERYIAPVTFIPWSLLLNRTVFFTYTMAASIYLAWYLWDTYFYSMLVVVFNQSVTQATYITNIYSVGSCFWAVLMGILIRYNGRLKWQALYFGVPITILGVGLMIKFREPGVNIGYIVMCQIFIAFGGGTLVICEQMTVMAVSSQQHIPAVLAMESMFINIGSAVGTTIATALWTAVDVDCGDVLVYGDAGIGDDVEGCKCEEDPAGEGANSVGWICGNGDRRVSIVDLELLIPRIKVLMFQIERLRPRPTLINRIIL
ncbi:unnamed protein product [Aspergillus oryzae]|nr:unnamed protein product [Aspergillus oryzae]